MTIGTMPPIMKQDLPAILRHERGGHETRNGAAERYTSNRDNRKRGAQFARRGFGIDGDDIGNNAADAKARQQAQPEHLVEIGRIGRGQREDAKQQVRPNQRRLAAVAVADPAEQAPSQTECR